MKSVILGACICAVDEGYFVVDREYALRRPLDLPSAAMSGGIGGRGIDQHITPVLIENTYCNWCIHRSTTWQKFADLHDSMPRGTCVVDFEPSCRVVRRTTVHQNDSVATVDTYLALVSVRVAIPDASPF